MGSSYSVPHYASLSSLTIQNWKNQDQITNFTKSQAIAYFKTNANKTELIFSLDALKYLDNEADLNAERLQLKFKNAMSQEFQMSTYAEPLELYSKWRNLHYYKTNYFKSSEFITTLNTLATIMCTQFDLKKQKSNWKISAKLEGNNIYLWQENDNTVIDSMVKHKELLKRHLFVKKPETVHRNLNSVFSETYYEIFEKYIGTHRMTYLAEIPGISSDTKINNFEQLTSAHHLFCDIFESEDFNEEIINYNPIWWCKSNLTNAQYCFIVKYNGKTERIQEVINFPIEKFNEVENFENIWSPTAAWNFLDLFFTFVKNEVNKVNSDYKSNCIWEFERDGNLIHCRIYLKVSVSGSIYYLPLPEDCFV